MKKIQDDYPNLVKYHISEQFEEFKVPEEMIELIKEWIPIHLCVGTVWGKTKPIEQREETKILSEKCTELKKKIFSFDFYGSIAFVVNGFSIIFKIYYDEELERKEYKWIVTRIEKLDFEWTKKK